MNLPSDRKQLIKAALLGASMFFTHLTVAEDAVRVEITGGVEQALPIAVTPFKNQQVLTNADYNIAQIIRDDLQRSGSFLPMPESSMSAAMLSGQFNLDYWRKMMQDYVVIGEVRQQANQQFELDMRLINTLTSQEIVARRWSGVGMPLLRTAAHQMSDAIYMAVTGRGAAFDSRMAYVKVDKTAGKRKMFTLEVADADGYGPKTILRSYMPLMSISWSPDGSKLAYVSFENRRPEIVVQSLDGKQRQSMAAFEGINSAPAWSPDGRRLLMTLSKGGNPDIYMMDVATKQLTQLTFDPAIETEAVWSADGQSIFFNSDRRGKPQIFQLAINSPRDVKRVTFDGAYNARPTASPDGNHLAYIRQVKGGGFKVTTQDLQSGESRVLSVTRTDETPSFSPNGDMIAYSHNDSGNGSITVLSRNGRETTRLAIKGDVRDPAWSPLNRQQ